MSNWIPALVVIAVIGGAGYFGYHTVKRKIERFSQTLFGTKSLLEGWNRQADKLVTTPKSVSAMTRVYEPQIQRDFPDFNTAQFKNKVENAIVAMLTAISGGAAELPEEVSEELRTQLRNRLEENRTAGEEEKYGRIRIHRTEIADYTKRDGKCIITFQSAAEHLHYKTKDGKCVSGDENRLEQTKYNTEVLYIQNETLAKKIDNAVGLTCPNCGAPITNLGAKYCEYCGLAVMPIDLKVWKIHKIYEV